MRKRAVPLRPVPELVLLARIVLRGRSAQASRNRQLGHVAYCVVGHSPRLRPGLAPFPAGHSSHPITRWPMGAVVVRLISLSDPSFRRSDRPIVDPCVDTVTTPCAVRAALDYPSRRADSRPISGCARAALSTARCACLRRAVHFAHWRSRTGSDPRSTSIVRCPELFYCSPFLCARTGISFLLTSNCPVFWCRSTSFAHT